MVVDFCHYRNEELFLTTSFTCDLRVLCEYFLPAANTARRTRTSHVVHKLVYLVPGRGVALPRWWIKSVNLHVVQSPATRGENTRERREISSCVRTNERTNPAGRCARTNSFVRTFIFVDIAVAFARHKKRAPAQYACP